MIDVLAGIVSHLKAQSAVSAQVGTLVFGLEVPLTYVPTMPRKMIVVRPSGGAGLGDASDVDVFDQRIDVFNYGGTGAEANAVHQVSHAALKAIERNAVTVNSIEMLIHTATRSSGGIFLRDPDGDWPLWLEVWSISASETALT
jgi:hypothetical protein